MLPSSGRQRSSRTSCRNPQNDARRSDRPRTADLRPRSLRAEHSCATALESVASLPEPARLLGSAVKEGSAVYERLGGGVEITRVPEVHQPVPACPRLLPLREPVGLGLGACSELPRRWTPRRQHGASLFFSPSPRVKMSRRAQWNVRIRYSSLAVTVCSGGCNRL